MKEEKEKQVKYEDRVYLFNCIPLWKVSFTKKQWQKIAFEQSSKSKIYELIFIDDKNKEY